MTRPQRWERDPMRSAASMLLRPTPEREAAARTARANLAALCCDRAGLDLANPDPAAARAAAADFAELCQALGLDQIPAGGTWRPSEHPPVRPLRVKPVDPAKVARTARIVALRERGMLFREIAEVVGLSSSAVQVAYQSEMARRAEEANETGVTQ